MIVHIQLSLPSSNVIPILIIGNGFIHSAIGSAPLYPSARWEAEWMNPFPTGVDWNDVSSG